MVMEGKAALAAKSGAELVGDRQNLAAKASKAQQDYDAAKVIASVNKNVYSKDELKDLAEKAKDAAKALELATQGADHFGVKAQAEAAEAARKKIAPAVAAAEARMKAMEAEKKKPLPTFKPTKFIAERSPLISSREYERYRTIAAAHGVKSIDGSPTRMAGGTKVSLHGEAGIGEVRRGDAARRKRFLRDEERKRLKGLTEVEALNDIVESSKQTATATKKMAKEIAG